MSDSHKIKLSVAEQIEYMEKIKGIAFAVMKKEEAKKFLLNHNYYFRLKAYAKNYERYGAGAKMGQYINLDFAYLRDLSIIDMHFRKSVLRMTVDVEHFLKTQVMREFEANATEDGYGIVAEYFSENPNVKENIRKLGQSSICANLIAKYNDKFALWNILEVLSFGDFTRLYALYFKKYPSKNDMSKFLWSARMMRNAAAHNNCLLNSLRSPYTHMGKKIAKNWEVTSFFSKALNIGKESLHKKFESPVIHDFLVTLYLFDRVVSSENVKKQVLLELREAVIRRFSKHAEYYSKNEVIKSNFDFLAKAVDFFVQKAQNDRTE